MTAFTTPAAETPVITLGEEGIWFSDDGIAWYLEECPAPADLHERASRLLALSEANPPGWRFVVSAQEPRAS